MSAAGYFGGILDRPPPSPGLLKRAASWLVNALSFKIVVAITMSVLACIMSALLDFWTIWSQIDLKHSQDANFNRDICLDPTKIYGTGSFEKCNEVRISLQRSPLFKTLEKFIRQFYLCGENGCLSYVQDLSSGFVLRLLFLVAIALGLFFLLSGLFTKLKMNQYKLEKYNKHTAETKVIRQKAASLSDDGNGANSRPTTL